MKKTLVMGAAICAVFAMTSCKSKESAYKKAYEKAKAQQTAVVQPTTPVQTTTPVTTVTTVTPQQTAPANDYSNVNVRTENVTLISGSALKAYSVVVGSFGVKANAEGLSKSLAGKGYNPRVLQATTSNGTMYRVVATSYDTKGEAAQSRAALEGQYPGAWLLYQK
ncbi:MAG: SPOR domain-containing protein [Bacteroidaceae bacterium]|jgi:cell division septation protein DedD|nr:SPOR domain-containing protein [Bacteroidaceae bacterium]